MIDEITYNQVNDNPSDTYSDFIKNNSEFTDYDTWISERKNQNTKDEYDEYIKTNPISTDISSWLKKKSKIDEEKIEVRQAKLDVQLEKDDDYKYVIELIWMEMYLPRFEMKYGKFNYSEKATTNKTKCEELLHYYAYTCGLKNIKEIYKKKPHKGMFR